MSETDMLPLLPPMPGDGGEDLREDEEVTDDGIVIDELHCQDDLQRTPSNQSSESSKEYKEESALRGRIQTNPFAEDYDEAAVLAIRPTITQTSTTPRKLPKVAANPFAEDSPAPHSSAPKRSTDLSQLRPGRNMSLHTARPSTPPKLASASRHGHSSSARTQVVQEQYPPRLGPRRPTPKLFP